MRHAWGVHLWHTVPNQVLAQAAVVARRRRGLDGLGPRRPHRGPHVVQVCVESKVQLVLQFGVSRGLREVLLAPVGRVYLSEIVSEFGPLRGPRRRDSENLTHWLISTQVRRRLRAEVSLFDSMVAAGAVRLSY